MLVDSSRPSLCFHKLAWQIDCFSIGRGGKDSSVHCNALTLIMFDCMLQLASAWFLYFISPVLHQLASDVVFAFEIIAMFLNFLLLHFSTLDEFFFMGDDMWHLFLLLIHKKKGH